MIFRELLRGYIAIIQNFEKGIDPGFHLEKLINDDDIFSGHNAITGLEIAFFIPDGYMEFFKNIFEPVEIMLGIFDHLLILLITKTNGGIPGLPDVRHRTNPAMKLEKSLIYPRTAFLALFLLLLTPVAYGQRFTAGMGAGFNACQIDGDMLAGFDKIGLTAGIRTTIEFESVWNVHMEFLYSERGSRPDVFNPEYDPDINISLKYVEIPVYVSLGDWWQEEGEYYKASFHAGLSYGRLLSARTTDYYHTGDDSYDQLVQYFSDNDLSWLVGAAIRFSPRWGMTCRYTSSITPLLNPAKYDLATERLRGYFLTFRLDYYFK